MLGSCCGCVAMSAQKGEGVALRRDATGNSCFSDNSNAADIAKVIIRNCYRLSGRRQTAANDVKNV